MIYEHIFPGKKYNTNKLKNVSIVKTTTNLPWRINCLFSFIKSLFISNNQDKYNYIGKIRL